MEKVQEETMVFSAHRAEHKEGVLFSAGHSFNSSFMSFDQTLWSTCCLGKKKIKKIESLLYSDQKNKSSLKKTWDTSAFFIPHCWAAGTKRHFTQKTMKCLSSPSVGGRVCGGWIKSSLSPIKSLLPSTHYFSLSWQLTNQSNPQNI